LFIAGSVVDADTQEPIEQYSIRVSTFTDGLETGSEIGVIFGESPTPGLPPPPTVGDFVTPFVTNRTKICEGIFGPPLDPPKFPQPDQLFVIVIRDTCETTYTIEVNGDTVVDLSFPNNTLELRDPILVPACETEGDGAP